VTPIFFILFYGIGLLLTLFRHPIFGLYTYMFAFYMAPSYTWWRNEIPDFRYMLLIGIVAVVASMRLPEDTNRKKWHRTGAGKLLILFVLLNWIQVAWAIDRELQIAGAIMYSKHLVAFYLFYRFSDSIERILQIAMAHVVGCFWFGWQALQKGGGRLEDIGGAVAGSNELGVHIATGVLFGGIMLLGIRDFRRWIIFGCLPFILNCLVLTVSRGAFLGLLAGGISSYFVVPKTFLNRFRIFTILGVVLFSMLAHDQLIERFTATIEAFTSEQKELDGSAASRTDIAKAGVQIGLDYPLGAGHRSTALLSSQYMDPHLLSSKGQRSAHNTFAAVFAEHGIPGLILYILMIGWVVRITLRIRRAGGKPNTEKHELCVAFAASSLIVIYVAGNFSNNIDLETQYWCLALLASASELFSTVVNKSVDAVQKLPVTSKVIAAPGKNSS